MPVHMYNVYDIQLCSYRLVDTVQHRIVTLYLPTHPVSELSPHRIMRIDVSQCSTHVSSQ